MLIRLCGCAGQSAPLLFTYGINRFSHDVAQVKPYCSNFRIILAIFGCQSFSDFHGISERDSEIDQLLKSRKLFQEENEAISKQMKELQVNR